MQAHHGDTSDEAIMQRVLLLNEISILQLVAGHPSIVPLLSVVAIPVDQSERPLPNMTIRTQRLGIGYSMPVAAGGTVFDMQNRLWNM